MDSVRILSSLPHDFRDRVSDGRASLFDLFPGQTDREADFEGRRSWLDLLGHRIIRDGLEAGDENAIGKALLRR